MTPRVALLVDSPSMRAHGNAASRLALGLVETGRAHVDLVCYSADPAPPWLPASVRIHRLGVDRISRSVPSLVGYLRAERPDVLITRQVHVNFFGMAASAIARTRGWNGKLVLVQDHPIEMSHASNRKDNKWAAKVTYRFADGVVSPSPEVLSSTVAWCGLPTSHTALVPNPVPLFTAELPPPPHPWFEDTVRPVFVHTSNMTYWKRLDLLIDAFAELLQDHQARLLLVGEGPGRTAADEQIERLGIAADVQTVGWVADPLEFAAHAWAFVLPSDEEGFGQVLTEAMSVSCPIIATDSLGGGPRFVTDNGTHGMLVPRGNQAALRQAMAMMLRPEIRELYAKRGRRRAAEFSPLASATSLVDFLASELRIGA